MTNDLPAPLVPPDLDLRDFPYMPVDIVRLFNSEFHARATDAEWRAGVTLWLKSYHQIPASSLPADDVALARLAEFGRDTKQWARVKAGALRGWVLCSDGRLYHRTVAEKAIEGWIEKLAQRKISGCGNARRHRHEFDTRPIDEAIETSRAMLMALNPQSRALSRRSPKVANESSGKPPGGSAAGSPDGSPPGVPMGAGREPQWETDGNPNGVPSKGKGRERNIYADAARERDQAGQFEVDCRKLVEPEPIMLAQDFHVIRALLEDEGLTEDDVRTGIGEALTKRSDPQMRYRHWSQIAKWCRTAAQNRLAGGPRANGRKPQRIATESDGPSFDFGGVVALHSTIRKLWSKRQWLPSWGPDPSSPDCRIPHDIIVQIMHDTVAA